MVVGAGSVKCFGGNWTGQLGLGDTENRGDDRGEMGTSLPAVDLGSGRTAVALAVGALHTCALLDDGHVKCWGSNSRGQLGLVGGSRGTSAGQMGDALPSVDLGAGRVPVGLTAGAAHSCAVFDDGTVRCWGANDRGQLGVGDTDDRYQPSQMGDALPAVALGTGRSAVAISSGLDHTCALLDDGQVKCWGANAVGQLGVGDTANRGDQPGELGDALPAVALGAGRTAVALSAGAEHTCALLDDGTLKCWGRNDKGQLGIGSVANRGDQAGELGANLPIVALGTGRTAVAVAAGESHTCAVLDDATTKCWGGNSGLASGALGLGDLANRGDQPGELGDALPAVALGSGRTVAAATAGGSHTCARLDDGTIKCWGANQAGALGLGDEQPRGRVQAEMGDGLWGVNLTTIDPPPPGNDDVQDAVELDPLVGTVAGTNVDASRSLTADVPWPGLDDEGAIPPAEGRSVWYRFTAPPGTTFLTVDTFGSTFDTLLAVYQAGAGGGIDTSVPVRWDDDTAGVQSEVQWAATAGVTYLVGVDGEAADGVHAATGDLTVNVAANQPVAMADMTQVAAGGGRTCAVHGDTTVRCWGGDRRWRQPDTIAGPGGQGTLTGVTQVAVGLDHACALLADQTGVCWGQNELGQVGDATQTTRPAPVPIRAASGPGPLAGIAELSASGMSTCARLVDGQVRCWGQVTGDGTRLRARPRPFVVKNPAGTGPLTGVAQIAAGDNTWCARLTNGQLRCWGGFVGDGTGQFQDLPAAVRAPSGTAKLTGVTDVDVGQGFSCATITGGNVVCWGVFSSGQLGDGRVQGQFDPPQLRPTYVLAASGSARLTGATQIAAGGSRACARLSTGQLRCWGSGPVGDGTTTARSTRPRTVRNTADTSALTGIAEVDAGDLYTCARLASSGGIVCWGTNAARQLGDLTTTKRLLPVAVLGS